MTSPMISLNGISLQSFSKQKGGIVVFSGGSAANSLVDVFREVSEAKACRLSYVIPISDNGGSTSEIIRVFGGPGIGDVRSRLVRLIPDDEHSHNPEKHAIRTFFNHRLSSNPQEARLEWLDLVEARHELWTDISGPKQELIRSFLNLLNLEIVKRVRPSSIFAFEEASIGNLFLTGARLFTGSFESAIYLLSSICMIPPNVSVLPAINTNFSHHICAGLENGDKITGQNAISHPSVTQPLPETDGEVENQGLPAESSSLMRSETDLADQIEDANLPGSLPSLRKQYISFSKIASDDDDLPARIERIWYINPYGQEIRPPPNPKILEVVNAAECIIYSIGSLYTSIVPSIVIRGIGEAVGRSNAGQKIMILNGTVDRETGPKCHPYTAMDFVKAVARAGTESRGEFKRLPQVDELKFFVTHLVHLEGEGVPKVQKHLFAEAGIETHRVYGRKDSKSNCMHYDLKALTQALIAIAGQRHVSRDRTRRNTLEH